MEAAKECEAPAAARLVRAKGGRESSSQYTRKNINIDAMLTTSLVPFEAVRLEWSAGYHALP